MYDINMKEYRVRYQNDAISYTMSTRTSIVYDMKTTECRVRYQYGVISCTISTRRNTLYDIRTRLVGYDNGSGPTPQLATWRQLFIIRRY